MNGVGWIGTVLVLLGLAGYVTGVVIEYPGRAFSVTALMIGIALTAIATSSEVDPTEAPP